MNPVEYFIWWPVEVEQTAIAVETINVYTNGQQKICKGYQRAGKDGPGESHYLISTKILPKEADYYWELTFQGGAERWPNT